MWSQAALRAVSPSVLSVQGSQGEHVPSTVQPSPFLQLLPLFHFPHAPLRMNQRTVYASSTSLPVPQPYVQRRGYQGRSRYAWAYLPKLREKKVPLGRKNLSREDAEVLYMKANWYRNANPDSLEVRIFNVLKYSSDTLPLGGIREGIVEKFLLIANKPRHIRLAIQMLTLHQNRDPNAAVSKETTSALVHACIRLGNPELAVSFLTLPWIRSHISRSDYNTLLGTYRDLSFDMALSSFAEGEHLKISVLDEGRVTDPLPENDEDEEEEEEDEEEENPVLGLSKSDRRKYHNFIENFMALYQSPRWSHVKPNSRYLSNILSFYANLGDVDNALKIYKRANGADPATGEVGLSDGEPLEAPKRRIWMFGTRKYVEEQCAKFDKYGTYTIEEDPNYLPELNTSEKRADYKQYIATFSNPRAAFLASRILRKARLLGVPDSVSRVNAKAVASLQLALVYRGRVDEASNLRYFSEEHELVPELIRSRLAILLAHGNGLGIVKLAKKAHENNMLGVTELKCHFGIPERVELLAKSIREIDGLSEEVGEYLQSIAPEETAEEEAEGDAEEVEEEEKVEE